MSRLRISLVVLGCSTLVAAWGSLASAQSSYPNSVPGGNTGYGQMAVGARPNFRAPGNYERVSGRSNPALTFFGGGRALPQASSGRAAMPAPQPVQTAAYSKPFTGAQQPTSSISPYLGLDQRESEQGLPNYYLFVKPQLDQVTTNQAQQVQNRRLQNQIRRATTAGIMPPGTSGGMPTTGHSTQFMNNGGYYPGLK